MTSLSDALMIALILTDLALLGSGRLGVWVRIVALQGVMLGLLPLLAAQGEPGVVVDVRQGCPVVACGTGGLVLTVVQRPGSRRMSTPDFVKGRPMPPGTRLGSRRPGSA